MAVVEGSADDLVALVGGLSSVRMDDYAVVGSYMRFGERVREQLKDARVRIAEACARPPIVTVTVKAGDTLSEIAAARGLTLKALLAFAEYAKYRANPGLIHPGDIVRVK